MQLLCAMATPPWVGATNAPPPNDGSGCASCERIRPLIDIAVNAFDDLFGEHEGAMEAPRCVNGNDRPADFAGLVALVEGIAAQFRIQRLEIACHGTGEEHVSEQRPYYRYPGALICGRVGELVAARHPTLDLNAHELAGLAGDFPVRAVRGKGSLASGQQRLLMQRLGRCVIPRGYIVWQACNLGTMSPYWGDFLGAARELAPHVEMSAANVRTVAGTPGLQGRRDETTQYRVAPAGGGAIERRSGVYNPEPFTP